MSPVDLKDDSGLNKESEMSGEKSIEKNINKILEQVGKFLYTLSVKRLIKIVVVFGVILTSYLIFDFFNQKAILEKRLAIVKAGVKPINSWGQEKPAFVVALEKNLRKGMDGNIFAFVPGTTLKAVMNKEMEWVTKAESRIQQLTFVGVWWDEGVPQVLIEDSADNESYALKQGQSLETFTIKTITEDSVVLEKKDKEWILQ